MARKGGLGVLKSRNYDHKEQLARATLRAVKLQGHTCVELRKDGKRVIFFCTLCLSPCYSETVLFDHLNGHLHTNRFAAAKVTLLKPNPWPFDDGIYFFHTSIDEEDRVANQNNSLAVVVAGEGGEECGYGLNRGGYDFDLLIPSILHKNEMCDLRGSFLGFGRIGARFLDKDGVLEGISRIWCEWLGNKESVDEEDSADVVQEHDFAVVTFVYNYDLGRKGFLDDVGYLLSAGEIEVAERVRKRRRRSRSVSDGEDVSESLRIQCYSSGEESASSRSSNTKALTGGYDDEALNLRVMPNKTVRKEMRDQERLASDRSCYICQHKMLLDKDVAILLNKKTGRVACSSRNVNGAFHVFHTSCLVHWILLCELELCTKQADSPPAKRRPRRRTRAKSNGTEKESEASSARKQMYSVFCPECQGTGIIIDGNGLEVPTVALSQMYRYRIKIADGRRAWMKSPEVLEKCTTGLRYPSRSEEICQGRVSRLKLLQFYRADE